MGQFSRLATNKKDFTPAQQMKVFVSSPYSLAETIPSKLFTLTTAVIANDVTASMTAASATTLYEGTRLNFGTEAVPKILYVADETVVGTSATVVPVEKAALGIATAATFAARAFYPYFSAKTYSLEVSPQEITDMVFSDGLYPEKAISSLNTSGSMSGAWVYDDPGMAQLIAAMDVGDYVYAEFIYPDGRGGRNAEFNCGIGESADSSGMIQRTANLIITGSVGFLAVNP